MSESQFWIVVSLIVSLTCCGEDFAAELDYCAMLKEDQSNLSSAADTKSIAIEKRRKRIQIFSNNFNDIIDFTMQYGFPEFDQGDLKQDSCKYWAVVATLVHVAQTDRDVFFSEKTKEVFSREIQSARLPKEILYPALKMGIHSPICDSLANNVFSALDLWGFEELKSDVRLQECDL